MRPGDCGPALAVLVKAPCSCRRAYEFKPTRGRRCCLPCGVALKKKFRQLQVVSVARRKYVTGEMKEEIKRTYRI